MPISYARIQYLHASVLTFVKNGFLHRFLSSTKVVCSAGLISRERAFGNTIQEWKAAAGVDMISLWDVLGPAEDFNPYHIIPFEQSGL